MLSLVDLINWTQLERSLVCVFKDEQLTIYGLGLVFSVLILLSNCSGALHTLSEVVKMWSFRLLVSHGLQNQAALFLESGWLLSPPLPIIITEHFLGL